MDNISDYMESNPQVTVFNSSPKQTKPSSANIDFVQGLPTKEYYEMCIQSKMDVANELNKIHYLHSNNLTRIRKDSDAIQPSEVLINFGYLKESDYIKIMETKMPLFDYKLNKGFYTQLDINTMYFDGGISKDKVLEVLVQLIKVLRTIPMGFRVDTKTLEWAVAEPRNIQMNEQLGRKHMVNKKEIRLEVGKISQALGAVNICIRVVTSNTFKDLVDEFAEKYNFSSLVESKWKPKSDQYPQKLILDGLIQGASDVHFYGSSRGLEVGYSILGSYLLAEPIPFSTNELLDFCNQIYTLCGVQPNTVVEPKVRDYDMNDLGYLDGYRGRVNILPNKYSSAVTIRILPPDMGSIPFEKLNIRDSIKRELETIFMNKYGIILVAGATGSGKSTTLHSILEHLRIKKPEDRIETVEKPVEHELKGISQIALTESSPITIEDVAEALTRRNAQILNIGEINTERLVRFSVSSALQQLLVISTIHSYSASAIPDRVKGFCADDGLTYEQFLQCLKGIIHQTMLKEICPNCKRVVSLEDSEFITNDMINVLEYYGYKEPTILISVKGNTECPMCHGKGHLIKKPIICVEVLQITNSIKRILQRKPSNMVSEFLSQTMLQRGTTGVNDALNYLREGRLSWLDIWDGFSLINVVGDWLTDDELAQQGKTR